MWSNVDTQPTTEVVFKSPGASEVKDRDVGGENWSK